MKKLRYPVVLEQSEYMRMRKAENLERCKSSKAEAWMNKKLESTGKNWSRQACWGYRIFDFWCHDFGCVIEVDGKEHDKNYDMYRDEYNFRRSGIVVLRVRNFNEQDAEKALAIVATLDPWKVRREHIGISKNKRYLSKIPYKGSMLREYLKNLDTKAIPWGEWVSQMRAKNIGTELLF